MSDNVIDVNEQLFTDRRNAIDSGQVTRKDNGTWVYADKSEVFGKEGLDTSTGQVALYTSVPAWHALGNVIPGGTTSVDEVLELGGIDFMVEKLPAKYWNTVSRNIQNVPYQFVISRSDTGNALGIVGKVYKTFQNHESFTFVQELVDSKSVLWESAGALNDGKRTFVCARLPEDIVIDAGGVNDVIRPILSVTNSHDGTTPITALLSPWRIVCGNTDRFAKRDAISKWTVKHTTNMAGRVEEARRALALTTTYFESYANDATLMARMEMKAKDMDKFLNELFIPEADKDGKVTDLKIRKNEATKAEVRYLFENGENNENIRGTKWAAVNAVTEYLDWFSPLRPRGTLKDDLDAARAHAIMDGRKDDIKTRAHELALRTVKR